MADTWKMLWRAAGEMGLCGSNGDGERRDAGRFLRRRRCVRNTGAHEILCLLVRDACRFAAKPAWIEFIIKRSASWGANP